MGNAKLRKNGRGRSVIKNYNYGLALGSSLTTVGVYGALGYHAVVKEPERRVREKRAKAKRKAAREAKALEKARASGVAVVAPSAKAAKKTATKKAGPKAGVVI